MAIRRDRYGRFAGSGRVKPYRSNLPGVRSAQRRVAGRSIRRGAGRGAVAGAGGLTALPIALSIGAGAKVTALGIAGAGLQGAVLGGPVGALAGATIAGGVYAARRRRQRR